MGPFLEQSRIYLLSFPLFYSYLEISFNFKELQ